MATLLNTPLSEQLAALNEKIQDIGTKIDEKLEKKVDDTTPYTKKRHPKIIIDNKVEREVARIEEIERELRKLDVKRQKQYTEEKEVYTYKKPKKLAELNELKGPVVTWMKPQKKAKLLVEEENLIERIIEYFKPKVEELEKKVDGITANTKTEELEAIKKQLDGPIEQI
eukprot:Platyproteum_vivax@DN7524_c0_g1_i3.p1